ncbi:MAG TPA: FAD:protein FMN transferase [Gaiellaceae bacterium]|nr:FAD:protein FMN transferase [Gaiellaceae bacterium]
MERRWFSAMGTTIELFVDAEGAEASLDAAEGEFHRLEAILSRFRESSELSRLNREGSADPSFDLRRVLELALGGRASTAGRFDPTVHDALVAAGYDRSFEQVPADGSATAGGAACGGDVRLDERVELGPGVRVDLGGIGKGYAAECAAMLLAAAGPCLVNAGGDLALRGGSWPTGVETPEGTLTLELTGGGLATSGIDRRRWRRGGREIHHVVDPATGEPAETDLLRITVAAGDLVEAEIWATALLVAGAEEAAAEADRHGLPSVLVTKDDRTILAGGLA